MQKFFVNGTGSYIGSYDGPDKTMPAMFKDGVQVPTAPLDARQTWANGAWQSYQADTPIAVLYPVHLWERMTQEEADAVGAVMAQQDFRTRQIFASASSYRSDHELWPLLQQIATQLFGSERAAVILAPSEVIPA